jgi:hypothetical protein
MKTLISVAVVSFILGAFAQVRAYEGMMCVNSQSCGNKCEVCVKNKGTDPMGTCHPIAGCY